MRQNVRLVSLERDGISQASCNNFAIQLVFDSIVKEDRASLNFKQITEEFNQPRQVILYLVVKRDILGYKVETQCVLECRPRFKEEVILQLAVAHHLSHEGNHSFLHHVRVKH